MVDYWFNHLILSHLKYFLNLGLQLHFCFNCWVTFQAIIFLDILIIDQQIIMALLPVMYYNHNLIHFIYKGLKHNYNTSVFCFIQLHVTRGDKCSIVQLLVSF